MPDTTVKQQFSRHPVKSPHTGSIRSRLNLTWSGYSADHVVALKTGDYNYSAFGFIATTPEKVGGVVIDRRLRHLSYYLVGPPNALLLQ